MQLENVSQKSSRSEKQCSELKAEVGDLTQKLSALKEKVRVYKYHAHFAVKKSALQDTGGAKR